MFEWAKLLFSKPSPGTPLTIYTEWNGVLYMLLGATFYVWPGSVQVLLRAPAPQAGEAGLVRALGITIAFIGYFYFFGGRTGQDRFGVATILDRLIVPVLVIPLVVSGELSPQLGLPFAVLDPVLAIGAWAIFARSQPTSGPASSGRTFLSSPPHPDRHLLVGHSYRVHGRHRPGHCRRWAGAVVRTVTVRPSHDRGEVRYSR
jgi:hypothetical protein